LRLKAFSPFNKTYFSPSRSSFFQIFKFASQLSGTEVQRGFFWEKVNEPIPGITTSLPMGSTKEITDMQVPVSGARFECPHKDSQLSVILKIDGLLHSMKKQMFPFFVYVFREKMSITEVPECFTGAKKFLPQIIWNLFSTGKFAINEICQKTYGSILHDITSCLLMIRIKFRFY